MSEEGKGGGRELVSECKFSLGQDALFLINLRLQKRILIKLSLIWDLES